MQRGRILYVILHREVSGAERAQAPLIREDPDALVACPPDTPTERFARELGARTVPLPYRVLRHSGGPAETARSVTRGLAGAVDLRRILGAHPERRLVFCTTTRPSMLASVGGLGLDRRLVWCVRDFLPPLPLRAPVRALAAWTASRVVCPSRAIADDLARGSQRLEEITRVIPPGVDLGRFGHRLASPGSPSAAVVGHVSPVKRTDMAVEIAARVAEHVPEFRLRIIGRAQFRDEDFALERELKRRVADDPQLRRVVELRGFEVDVGAALTGSGILLHCCDDEPFGIALIEAMAMGLPVVAPASAGPLEIVADRETGLLYPPGDIEAASTCVTRLCRHPELARALGGAARRRVEARFSLDRQLRDTRALIDEVLA